MSVTFTATKARVHFGELLRRVHENNETVFVERGGETQAVVLPVAEYDRLRRGADREEWEILLDHARAQIRADLNGRRLPPADETIGALREERDAQLLGLR